MTDITTNADAAATYTGIVVEYSNVDAALAILRGRYADVVFPVDTKDGMKDAKEVRSKLVKLRTGLEAKRKEIKEPALRRAQAIDAEAKAITAAIKAIEDPIDAQIKVEEARIEAEKEAKRQAEAELAAERQALAEASAALEKERAEIDAMRASLIQQQMRALDEAEDKAIVAAPAVAPAGAETEQVAKEAEPVASLFEEEPADIRIPTSGTPVADWTIRQAAIHTAAQFTALAGKVEQCGFIDFAVTLNIVAASLRDGTHDAALAHADRDALIAADTLLLDATAACIEVLSEQQAAA